MRLCQRSWNASGTSEWREDFSVSSIMSRTYATAAPRTVTALTIVPRVTEGHADSLRSVRVDGATVDSVRSVH